ncbi:hypothetical protein PIB30_095284 [Stylosanthes scabra]|uniref:Uncharacterized protein n=1 Tax=Stylosanthes scabra TaxID=79078 RepID=A0ABU6TXR6_9FABA|nr:hypothetical protein [Stylosanthes scabra]
METQDVPVTIANLAIHRHREEKMNRERMRHNQMVQEAAAERAREANKGKTREVAPNFEEEESEEMYSSPSKECKEKEEENVPDDDDDDDNDLHSIELNMDNDNRGYNWSYARRNASKDDSRRNSTEKGISRGRKSCSEKIQWRSICFNKGKKTTMEFGN